MRRVAILVDHPQRDLAGMVLVARELCARGLECALVPIALQHREVLCLAPDVLLVSYLRKHNEGRLRRFLDLGIRIALLDGEGGVVRSAEAYGRILSGREDVRRDLGRFLSWGVEMADHATREKWFRPEQVVVTGHPRFDFYSARLSAVFGDEVVRARGLEGPIVLVNGAFPLANPRFLSTEQELALLEGQGNAREFLAVRLDAERRALAGLIDLTRSLAGRIPGATFVVRPHPFEATEPYERSLAALRNVRVIAEGTVTPWIGAARAVIHRGCTTAIEAALAGRPALEPKWLPTVNDVRIIEGASRAFWNEEDLAAAVEEAVRADGRTVFPLPEELKEELRRWFGPMDGAAHVRVARELETLAEQSDGGVSRARLSDALWELDRRDLPAPRRLARRVRRAVGGQPDLSDGFRPGAPGSWPKAAKAFDRRDVETFLSHVPASDIGFRGAYGDGRIDLRQAETGSDYCLPFGSGLSVVLRPGGVTHAAENR